jgi:hypothetical protein
MQTGIFAITHLLEPGKQIAHGLRGAGLLAGVLDQRDLGFGVGGEAVPAASAFTSSFLRSPFLTPPWRRYA